MGWQLPTQEDPVTAKAPPQHQTAGGKVLVKLVEKLVDRKQGPVKGIALNGNALVARLPEGLEGVPDSCKNSSVAFTICKRNGVIESNPCLDRTIRCMEASKTETQKILLCALACGLFLGVWSNRDSGGMWQLDRSTIS